VGVILAAAGQARRMGMGINKVYILLQGKPVLEHSLHFFSRRPEVRRIVVVVNPKDSERCREIIARFPDQDRIIVVNGGKERQESVERGLAAMPEDIPLVAVHDGARPLVSGSLFERLLDAISDSCAGVIPGLPVNDTVKQVDERGLVAMTVPRQGLYAVQTPQIFRSDVLRLCYQKAARDGFCGTDDAGLVEHYGYLVRIVPGDSRNIKITAPDDIELAHFYLERGKNPCE